MVKIWRENPETQTYEQAGRLSLASAAHGEAHKDWVRDVAWCNNVGIMTEMIATVGEDQAVRVWRSEPQSEIGATSIIVVEARMGEGVQ